MTGLTFWRLSNTFDVPTDKIFEVKTEVLMNMDPGNINQNVTFQTLVQIYQQCLGKNTNIWCNDVTDGIQLQLFQEKGKMCVWPWRAPEARRK